VEVNVDGEAMVIGALADSVQEVFELADDQIEPPPSIGTRLDTEFISGMGKQGDQFTIILDIDKVFSVDELNLFTETEGLDTGMLSEDTAENEQPAENAAV
jgi:purine-binding chemotaxis protein CheW